VVPATTNFPRCARAGRPSMIAEGFRLRRDAGSAVGPGGGARLRKEWGSDPQGPCGLGGFRNRCRRPTLGLPFHTGSPVPERMASGSNARTARHRGRCFPSRPLTSRAAIQEYLAPSGRAPESAAESGLFESHALRHASASNGARRACPVHSPRFKLRTVPGIRTLNLHGLNVAPLTSWARTAC
jgi:hypothetical protein